MTVIPYISADFGPNDEIGVKVMPIRGGKARLILDVGLDIVIEMPEARARAYARALDEVNGLDDIERATFPYSEAAE